MSRSSEELAANIDDDFKMVIDKPHLIEAYRIRGSFTDFRYYTWVCFEYRTA